jgi:ankyrin repeat protein
VVQISMENSDEDIFKMLIRVEGFDVNRINRNGENYLEVAIMMNNVGFLAKILERKVNPKLKNAEGESILQVTIKNSVQR